MDDGNLKALLLPCPADQMRMWEVSPRVNSPKNDDLSIYRSGDLFVQSQQKLRPTRLNWYRQSPCPNAADLFPAAATARH